MPLSRRSCAIIMPVNKGRNRCDTSAVYPAFDCASLSTGMRVFHTMMSCFWVTGLCVFALRQNPQNKDTQPSEVKGLPPRATPADYEAHDQAGAFTLATEFKGHTIPTQEATYS